MLQQTQVDTVVPYFLRFLRVFPTIERLARAPLERVLECWSGLGYYRRARNLHRAAQRVVQDFGGAFPSSYQEARLLPGVGDYTARAVLSIAYNQPYTVVDGNIARVVSRLRKLRGNLHQQKFRRAVNDELEQLLSRRQAGSFNQAVMELGQSVCLPRAPKCPLCPLRSMCQAYRDGAPEAYPEPRPRRAHATRYLATVVLCRAPHGGRHRPSGKSKFEARNSKLARHAARTGRMSLDFRISIFDPKVRASQRATRQVAKPQVALARGLDEGLMDGLWNFPAAFGDSPAEALRRLQARLMCMTTATIRWENQLAEGFALDIPNVGPGLAPAKADPAGAGVGPTAAEQKRQQDSRFGAHSGPEGLRPVARLRHGITYRSIIVDVYMAEVWGKASGRSLRWFTLSRLPGSPVSSLTCKIAERVVSLGSP
jgi:A/G-specific adenine glycosylase